MKEEEKKWNGDEDKVTGVGVRAWAFVRTSQQRTRLTEWIFGPFVSPTHIHRRSEHLNTCDKVFC